MTLDEAINELQNQCWVPNTDFQKPEYQARALGIEALKRINNQRSTHAWKPDTLLPGETTD